MVQTEVLFNVWWLTALKTEMRRCESNVVLWMWLVQYGVYKGNYLGDWRDVLSLVVEVFATAASCLASAAFLDSADISVFSSARHNSVTNDEATWEDSSRFSRISSPLRLKRSCLGRSFLRIARISSRIYTRTASGHFDRSAPYLLKFRTYRRVTSVAPSLEKAIQ